MKQRDAVYNAITSVLKDSGVHFEDGTDVSPLLTKELRGKVHAIVAEGFTSGTIEFDPTAANQAKLADEAKLNAYVSGLISNWVRKDKRFNGGVSYVAKNPGSRMGSSDDQLKTLRALRKQFAGTEKETIISEQIDRRVAELRAATAKKPTVSAEQLASLPSDVLEALNISA